MSQHLSPNSWDQLVQAAEAEADAKQAPVAMNSVSSTGLGSLIGGGYQNSGTLTIPSSTYTSPSYTYGGITGIGTLSGQNHYYPIVVKGADGQENLRIDSDGEITTRPTDFAKVRMTDAIVAGDTNKVFIWDVIFGMRGVKNNGRTLDASGLNMIDWIGALMEASKLYQSNAGYAGMTFHEFAMKVVGKPKRIKRNKISSETADGQ